jgi:hypothetical protein
MKKSLIIFLIPFSFLSSNDIKDIFVLDKVQKTEGLIQSSELTSYSTTIFPILGSTPAKINNCGNFKSVKLDWFISANMLKPDIAVELYPLWYLIFKNKSYLEYKEMNYFVRKLSDFNISVGTKNDGTNSLLGVSLCYPIYRKADPMVDTNLISSLEIPFSQEEKTLRRQLTRSLVSEQTVEVTNQIREIEGKLDKINKDKDKLREEIIKNYREDNWNKEFVNICFANITKYYLSQDYSKFAFITNISYFWVHAGFGISKILLNTFITKFSTTYDFENGINIRIAKNEDFSFFIEGLLDSNLKHKKDYFKLATYRINTGFNVKMIKLKMIVGLGIKIEIKEDNLVHLRPSFSFNNKF